MDRPDPMLLLAGQTTVSDQIRALHHGGYSRAEIARLLNKRYQHVRNVLVEDERRGAHRVPSAPSRSPGHTPIGMAETSAAYIPQAPTGPVLGWLDVEPQGVLRLPDSVKQALGVGDGDRVLVEVDGEGSVRLLSADAAMRRAQEMVRAYIPEGVSLVDDFLAWRRREAEREWEESEKAYNGG